jgi:acetyl-CoA acetyltransferase
MAKNIVCVFADTPILPKRRGGDAYAIDLALTNVPGWERQYGLYGAVGAYGMAMRRYMELFGAGAETFGEVAIAAPRWAQRSPLAFLTKSMSMNDYLGSKLIADPLRMFDCAFPVNGAGAVVISAPGGAGGEQNGAAYI